MKANGEIKIEKGIPIPPDGRGATPKYPWNQMEVGYSFLGAKTVSRNIGTEAKKRGWRFTTRAEAGGRRVWRIT